MPAIDGFVPPLPGNFGELPDARMPGDEPGDVREIDGKLGTLGSDDTLPPVSDVVPTRERIFDFSPSDGENSLMTPLIFSGSATFFWFDRNAKYESGMSSKSMTRSHSSHRHVGGSCG